MMKLYLVPPLLPTWVHPTVHPHSLAVDAYLRMCNVPCEREALSNPGLTPTGDEAPVLCINEGVATSGMEDNLLKLQRMGYKLEQDDLLTPLQKAECSALTALIVEKLWKCQLFDLWSEVENYESFTRITYSHVVSFPLKWWLDRERKKNMQEYLTLSGYDDSEKVKRTAKEIYEALSVRLGDDKHFFFGDSPTTFDCIVFGFLQTQACKEIPQSIIQDFLFSHKNLVDFCNRITENWYMSGVDDANLVKNNLNYKPLLTYISKKEDQGIPSQERNSLVILGTMAAIFVYLAFFQDSKSR
eukprot:TRINITY_DN253_c0_g1_i1.p1 TRINITY_DN253_c0_g1~~TRINITY_DN253_c0_g1_i1.p1  ORF type:complete len:300 (-),score=64.73 TRINITY_DN253_c0_g1_i1:76-975(-)